MGSGRIDPQQESIGMGFLRFTGSALAIMTVALSAAPSFAATFCVAGIGFPLQCLYEDVPSCVRASEPPNTYCSVNPEATLSYVGGSPYCAVGANRVAECLYVDRNQCMSAALKQDGVCFDREAMQDDRNPYRFDNRIQR